MGSKRLDLSPQAACLIIEASAKAGVSELKFGNLYVKFGKPAEIQEEPPMAGLFVQQNPAPAAVNDLTEAQHTQQSKASLEADEIRMREDQLAIALVEDPLKFEELLQQGELADGLDDSDDADDE